MKITIQPKDFTAKDELLDFVKGKTEKLFRLYDKILSCEVVLSIEKSDTRDNKICQIRLNVPGNDLLASAQSQTFEESTMNAIEGLERQIERRKTQEISRA